MEILEYTSRVKNLAAPLDDKVKSRYTVGVQLRLKELQNSLTPLIEEIDSIKKFLYYGKNEGTMKFSGPKAEVSDEHLAILHGQLGIITESLEILEIPSDNLSHLTEEAGDIMWYIAYMLYSMNVNPEEVMDLNIEKLEKKRYAKGFTAEQAINRDTDAEAKIFSRKT